MSKQIKVIQCPKCGSTQKIELKPDYYQCQNCNTEYFLDSNDININHNYINTPPVGNPGPVPNTDKIKKTVWSVFLVIIAVFCVSRWIVTCNTPKQPNSASMAIISGDSKEFDWRNDDALAFIGAGQKPILVVTGDRDYIGDRHERKKGAYASFYDLLSGKELNSQRLTGISTQADGNYKIKSFSNGKTYVIANKTIVFAVNKTAFTIEDVTKTEFQNQPDLVSGIANVDFVYDNYGDAFNIVTNDGRNLYYYPVINKIYTKVELYKAEVNIETLLPGAKNKTAFAFSKKSSDYPDEKIQLIKYIYKDNNGGPKDDPRFEWTTAYSAYGGKSKVFIDQDRYRIGSYVDFTPGRVYFEPKVLYSGDNYVLISYQNTPAEKAPTAVQCLNAHTGAIIFTSAFPEQMYLYGAFNYRDGFVIKSNLSTLVIGMDGKILKTFKLY